jgi:protein phosphatase
VVAAAGDTHVGKVRAGNEDALIVEPELGLYAVLDGMGGANAGDVASQLARDVIRAYVREWRGAREPREVLEGALQAGGRAVHTAAQASADRHGMGTTAVACLLVDAQRAIVAHAGDSRAYLLRAGRLQRLTRDHTVVEELVSRGLLSAEDAERHPHKNVLSRNLGARADARIEVAELPLVPGDRLLLCSDGLYGYAATEGIQYLLGSGDPPAHVCRDLIELALRGGGGDNVSAIVIEATAPPPTATQVVRTSGAGAWWRQRDRFLAVARDRGLPRNAIVRGVAPDEAIELVAVSLFQAVYHDLERSTGVNVWTFAQSLAGGWLERGGAWAAVRGIMDILDAAATAAIDQIRAGDSRLGSLVEIAVTRALVVAELALGSLLADRLRSIDAELLELHALLDETAERVPDELMATMQTTRDSLDRAIAAEAARQGGPAPGAQAARASERYLERPTLPFLRLDRPVTSAGISADVLAGIHRALAVARARAAPRATLVHQIFGALDAIAAEGSGQFAAAVLAARELYGARAADEAGIAPLFEALDLARVLAAAAVHQVQLAPPVRARVLRALSTAHQRLVGATTGLVLEATLPAAERLRDAQARTAELREQVARAERRRADLERRFATLVDPSLPWGARGNTEW